MATARSTTHNISDFHVLEEMVERFTDDDIIFKLVARNQTFPVISSGLDGTREAVKIVVQDTNPDNWLDPMEDLLARAPRYVW
jgi:hypothetical protein